MELTAIILTFNEETHIEACIASLDWTDRIVLFDSFSTDATVALAKSAGAEIYQSPFENYAQQRNAALKAITTDWVLFIDADERTSPELGSEIRKMISNDLHTGYNLPRHNYLFGKLTLGAGWFPDHQLRLFRHAHVHYERPVHEIAVVDGSIGYLTTPLIHYNYETIPQFHLKQATYTDYDAQILANKGIKPKIYTPYTQAVRHFYWRFISLKGYQDQLHGLRLSLYMAYYEWVKYQKLKKLTAR